MNSPATPPRNGEAAAALFAVLIGCAVVAAAHLWSVSDPPTANRLLYKLGSWMPGWYGIGPFAGKETAGAAAWLCSWLLLWLALRSRDVNLRIGIYMFAGGFFALLILLWPPVYHAFLGWLPALP